MEISDYPVRIEAKDRWPKNWTRTTLKARIARKKCISFAKAAFRVVRAIRVQNSGLTTCRSTKLN